VSSRVVPDFVRRILPGYVGAIGLQIATGVVTASAQMQPDQSAATLAGVLIAGTGQAGSAIWINRLTSRHDALSASSLSADEVTLLNHDVHELIGRTLVGTVKEYRDQVLDQDAKGTQEAGKAIDHSMSLLSDKVLEDAYRTCWPEVDYSGFAMDLSTPEVLALFQPGAAHISQPLGFAADEWRVLLQVLVPRLTDLEGVYEQGLIAYVDENFRRNLTYLMRTHAAANTGITTWILSELLAIANETRDGLNTLRDEERRRHDTLVEGLCIIAENTAALLEASSIPVRMKQELDALSKAVLDICNAATALGPRPQLSIPPRSSNPSALDFRDRITEVVGRDSVQLGLSEFLLGNGFRYARLTGEAGAGKSRLALDLCDLAERNGWEAGFLVPPDKNESVFSEWWRWNTTKPLLVVVDYALSRREGIGRLLAEFGSRSAYPHPIRVLLLARERPGRESIDPAWATLRSNHATALGPFPESTQDWHLENLTTNELAAIMASIAGKDADAMRAPAEKLASLDGSARPLFAILGAEAIARGDKVTDWSPEGLATALFEHEERRWQGGVDLYHVNALQLATQIRGLSIADLPAEPGLLPSLNAWNADSHLKLAALTGEFHVERLQNVRPDYLGEALVLRRLRKQCGLAPNVVIHAENAEQLLLEGWKRSPEEMAEFVVRFAQNFGNEPECEQVVRRPQLSGEKGCQEAAERHWLAIVPRLVIALARYRNQGWVTGRLSHEERTTSASTAFAEGYAFHVRSNSEEGTGNLQRAIEAYETAARLWENTDPSGWAMTQNNLGAVLQVLGKTNGNEADLRSAVAAYQNALKVRTREALPADWAMTQNNLGSVLQVLGQTTGNEADLRSAVDAFLNALTVLTRAARPADWATTQNNLGNVLQVLGQTTGNEADLRSAVDAYQNALNVRTREALPAGWAMTQNNLGNVLQVLGQTTGNEADLRSAVDAYQNALKVYTREALPAQWAGTQNNLGTVLRILGETTDNEADLRSAVDAYLNALKVRTREAFPAGWAMTQNNLGIVLLALGQFIGNEADLRSAVDAYQNALKVLTREALPADWAMTQNNLGNVLRVLGETTGNEADLRSAVAAFQTALKVYTREALPAHWAGTRANLARAQLLLGARDEAAENLWEVRNAKVLPESHRYMRVVTSLLKTLDP
jgi:tetratricopeptide (TPR) repeat protein